MKLPCAVTRDLLPLYVENMVEQETKVLVKEHLDECDACREKLSEMSVSSENPIDTARPLQNLKKQIQIKRLYAAALAALFVFIGVFTYFFRETAIQTIPWQDGLVEVVGIESYPPDIENTDEALVLNLNSIVNGINEHYVVEDDGTKTLIIQALSTNHHFSNLAQSYYEYSIFPVPDRVIYGLQQPQQLLWGLPMNGATEILPRLALTYYILIAVVAAGVCGLIWALVRKRKYSWILRQFFFVPSSYILSHLLLKGIRTTSFDMEHDLFSVFLVALAIYALFTIAWQVFFTQRKS